MFHSFGFSFSKGTYGKLRDKELGLHVRITASSDNRDIREITGILRTSEFVVEVALNGPTDVGVIAFMADQRYNREKIIDPDLMTILEGYIASLPDEDVMKLSELLPIQSKDRETQRIVELFAIRISIYLLGLAFLSRPEVMDMLPFQFSLPFDDIEGNVMSKGMFDYLTIPFRAILASGAEGEVIDLIGLMNEFINEWEGLFELGKKYDAAKVTIEVLNGYIQYTVGFIGRVKEIADKVLSQLPQPSKDGKVELPATRLDRLEKQVDNIVSMLESKSDDYFGVISLGLRLKKLEGEVDRLKGRDARGISDARRKMD